MGHHEYISGARWRASHVISSIHHSKRAGPVLHYRQYLVKEEVGRPEDISRTSAELLGASRGLSMACGVGHTRVIGSISLEEVGPAQGHRDLISGVCWQATCEHRQFIRQGGLGQCCILGYIKLERCCAKLKIMGIMQRGYSRPSRVYRQHPARAILLSSAESPSREMGQPNAIGVAPLWRSRPAQKYW